MWYVLFISSVQYLKKKDATYIFPRAYQWQRKDPCSALSGATLAFQLLSRVKWVPCWQLPFYHLCKGSEKENASLRCVVDLKLAMNSQWGAFCFAAVVRKYLTRKEKIVEITQNKGIMLLREPPLVVLLYIASSHVQDSDAAQVYIGSGAFCSVANMYIIPFSHFVLGGMNM